MNRRSAIRTVLAGTLAILLAAPATAGERQFVIMQINSEELAHWRQALATVRNLLTDAGRDRVQIELVAYGPAVQMLRFDSVVSSPLTELAGDGVWLRACGNSLRAQQLRPADLHDAAEVIPSGVVRIIERQKQGWVYIKP